MSSSKWAKRCGCLKLIAHPVRLRILEILKDGEKSVGQINALLRGISQSNLSQHLKAMKDNGILKNRRVKTQIMYMAKNQNIFDTIKKLEEICCKKNNPE